uniref:Uncharacterized protein n=1 Tax=Rhizophora mucronata TaxID=61149 RepID=A0A2P2QZF2_RHIMU
MCFSDNYLLIDVGLTDFMVFLGSIGYIKTRSWERQMICIIGGYYIWLVKCEWGLWLSVNVS